MYISINQERRNQWTNDGPFAPLKFCLFNNKGEKAINCGSFMSGPPTPLLNIAYLNSNEVSTSIIWSHNGFFFSNPSLFILNITEELLNGQWLHKTMLSPLERLHEPIEPLIEVGCLGHNGVGIKVTCFAELISCDPNAIDTIWSQKKGNRKSVSTSSVDFSISFNLPWCEVLSASTKACFLRTFCTEVKSCKKSKSIY